MELVHIASVMILILLTYKITSSIYGTSNLIASSSIRPDPPALYGTSNPYSEDQYPDPTAYQ